MPRFKKEEISCKSEEYTGTIDSLETLKGHYDIVSFYRACPDIERLVRVRNGKIETLDIHNSSIELLDYLPAFKCLDLYNAVVGNVRIDRRLLERVNIYVSDVQAWQSLTDLLSSLIGCCKNVTHMSITLCSYDEKKEESKGPCWDDVDDEEDQIDVETIPLDLSPLERWCSLESIEFNLVIISKVLKERVRAEISRLKRMLDYTFVKIN